MEQIDETNPPKCFPTNLLKPGLQSGIIKKSFGIIMLDTVEYKTI